MRMSTLADRIQWPANALASGEPSSDADKSSTRQSRKYKDNDYLIEVAGILESLSQIDKIATYEDFKKRFGLLKDWLEKNKRHALLINNELLALIDRCVNVKKYWPRDELLFLINTGMLPGSVCNKLFCALVEHGEIVLLYNSLVYIHDIPESALITCLQYFIKCDDEACNEADENGVNGADLTTTLESIKSNPYGVKKSKFINKVMTAPYNDVFLLEYLRKLGFQEALDLLRYFLYMLCFVTNDDSNQSESKNISAKKSSIPSLLQVVDWISLLLDAHFSQLVLSVEARTVLVDLHSLVESQVQFVDELVSLEGILSQLKEKSAFSPKQNVGLYCIETLHL